MTTETTPLRMQRKLLLHTITSVRIVPPRLPVEPLLGSGMKREQDEFESSELQMADDQSQKRHRTCRQILSRRSDGWKLLAGGTLLRMGQREVAVLSLGRIQNEQHTLVSQV